MHKLLLLLLLSNLIGVHAGQAKIRFTDTSNRWTVVWDGGGTEYYRYIISYEYGRDTVVNGLSYKRLDAKATQTVKNMYIVPPYRSVTNRFLFREDTLLDKLYCFDTLANAEHLIYDGAWQIGDSLVTKDPQSLQRSLYISAIDSVTINGESHRVFQFNQSRNLKGDDAFAIIEGIGSTSGPWLPASAMRAGGESAWGLYCFKTGGIAPPLSKGLRMSSYGYGSFNNTTSCGMVQVNVPEVSLPEPHVSIIPTPAGRRATLRISPALPDAQILIYDATGRRLFRQQSKGEEDIEIGTALGLPGIYFYEVRDLVNSRRLSGRFIAQ